MRIPIITKEVKQDTMEMLRDRAQELYRREFFLTPTTTEEAAMDFVYVDSEGDELRGTRQL